MNSKILGFLTVGFLAGPMSVDAAQVSGQIQGAFFGIQGNNAAAFPFSPLPINGQPDTYVPYSYTLTWDTAMTTGPNCAPSCFYGAGGSTPMSITNFTVGTLSGATLTGSAGLIVTNNGGWQGGELGDQYVFDISGVMNGLATRIRVFFGTDDLNYIAGIGTSVPGVLPPLTNVYDRTRWQQGSSATDTSYSNFTAFGQNGFKVPEPGTLALLGIGLAGLGLSRRRKAH